MKRLSGGGAERNFSENIVSSLKRAKKAGIIVRGVDRGYTANVAAACVVIPPLQTESGALHVEGFQIAV